MRIIPISNIYNFKALNRSKPMNSNVYKQKESPYSVVRSENIKANYCPAFGKYRKAGNVMLINRDSHTPELAVLKREKFGKDIVSYKVYINGQEAGYMDMDCSSVFPEDDDFVLTEPDNVIPEIKHIRTLKGDKYSGIGTALVNAAVKESLEHGKNGCLWLKTERGYAWSLSQYRANENPIPFYYKLGFKAINSNTEELIKNCLKNTDYKNLPDSVLLLLTPDAIKEKNKYFSSNFIYS